MIEYHSLKCEHFVQRLLICLFFVYVTSLFATPLVSIYDIQFTMNAGFDGTFPSTYLNQTVRIQGVVTATGFDNGRVFVSMPSGGAWSAICVEIPHNQVSVGNFIEVQGRVNELMGMTTLTNIQNLRILQHNSPLPNPVSVSVHDALTNEAYEAVLVRVMNVRCVSKLNGNFLATISDDTATINLGNGFRSNISDDLLISGNQFQHIVGIVHFSFNRFSLHPRSSEDVLVIKVGQQSSSWGKIKSLYR